MIALAPSLLVLAALEIYFGIQLKKHGPYSYEYPRILPNAQNKIGAKQLPTNLPPLAPLPIGTHSPSDYRPSAAFPIVNSGALALLKPDWHMEHFRASVNGTAPIKVSANTDGFSRRISKNASPNTRSFFIALWGCSFTFGTNVDDSETLSSQIAEALPDTATYNYGMHGGGPNDALLRFTLKPPKLEIKETKGIGIYIFMDDQLKRLVGTMSYVGSWHRHTPLYEESGGALVYRGTFSQAHPALYLLYRFLARSNILEYFAVDFPFVYHKKYAALAALHFKAIAQKFAENFLGQKFVVVFFPGYEHYAEILKPQLDKENISYLDYSALPLDRLVKGPLKQPDGHPMPEVYKFVARQIVRDLSQAGWIDNK
ncbi:MAG: hypothetical protein AB7K68_17395 [Bacteriovoracia bacterium]